MQYMSETAERRVDGETENEKCLQWPLTQIRTRGCRVVNYG